MKHKTPISLVILIIFSIIATFGLNFLINHPQTSVRYNVEVAFPNLSFDYPVGIYSSGDGTNRLFVIGQMGLIYVFENSKNVAES